MDRPRSAPLPDPVDEPRSEATRRRLIEAGLEAFGRHGLHGVTTRQLAGLARVNQAAIPYHFGGKEGVYRAVAEHLVETTGAAARGFATQAVRDLDGGAPRDELAARVTGLLTGIIRLIAGLPDAPARGGYLLREQLQPTAAFDILYTGFMQPVHEALSRLVGGLTGRPPEAEETIVRAHAMLGQAFVFGISREALFRRLGVAGYTPERIETIARIVAEGAVAGLAGVGVSVSQDASSPPAQR